MRRVNRSAAVAAATIATLITISGCGSKSTESGVYGGGWPGLHGDARNSNSTSVTGPDAVHFEWSRPLGGLVSAPASVAITGQTTVAARTDAGCNVFSLDGSSGRKRWCVRLPLSAVPSAAVVDNATNVYVGTIGALVSYTDIGQLRWRSPLNGAVHSAQFTADGQLLVLTQLGQVNILDRQTGKAVIPAYELIPGINPTTPDAGIDFCTMGGAACPVVNSPALDRDSDRFYFTFWRPGAAKPALVAMSYHGGDAPTLTEDWTSDVLPNRNSSSPVLSEDGETLYVGDGQSGLWAIDTSNGRSRWQYQLDFTPANSPSVASDGTIIPSGAEGAPLLALTDRGDHAELKWERRDLSNLSSPALAAGDRGYTTVRDGADGLALLIFDTGTGETVQQDVMPGAFGFSPGLSIGPDREVIAPTAIGEVFSFWP